METIVVEVTRKELDLIVIALTQSWAWNIRMANKGHFVDTYTAEAELLDNLRLKVVMSDPRVGSA
ncbi:MAG: hypothetical protein KGL39_58725 [Patescibacteria group bacterium]|nr:hypothetical protein [Patescibacteria group bacterium]